MHNFFVKILSIWLILSTLVVTSLNFPNKVAFARLMMGWGLIIFWVIIGGYLMYKNRDKFREFFNYLPGKWTTKFLVFSIIFAMIEEVITTTMTNLAPLFGSSSNIAFITGSTNYLQVIFHHSVVIFVPLFVGWLWLLKRYNFTPNQVFWLFGIIGAIAEGMFNDQFGAFTLWIFVYGLMVYLPAYSVPKERGAREVRFYHYPLAFIAPIFFFVCLFLIATAWDLIGLPTIPNFGVDLIPIS